MNDAEEATVMLVDDEPTLVDLYETFLSGEYDVRTATGGTEALEVMDESVDVALLDRRMPELSGDEVLLERATYDDQSQEFFSLASKKAALGVSGNDDTEEYERLTEELEDRRGDRPDPRPTQHRRSRQQPPQWGDGVLSDEHGESNAATGDK